VGNTLIFLFGLRYLLWNYFITISAEFVLAVLFLE